MYKLVAIDLDGTMLNNYGEVSKNTIQTIKQTMQNGVEVVIASGRAIDSITPIADEIGINKNIIAGNGAIIYNNTQKNIVYENFIPKFKALQIMKICEKNNITYSVYTSKTIVANSLKYNILYYHNENLKKPENKRTKIKIVNNIYDYIKNTENENVIKISICDDNKSIFTSIIKKLKQIKDIEILDIEHSTKKIIKNGSQKIPMQYYYTEISQKNVDKWTAINLLANKMGINQNEIIAIGDNINDKKMISNAGLGVAMKGSTPSITEIADYITETDNNNDGVANTLKKFCSHQN